MESLSRPPHRRKHSGTGHAFSSNSSASSFSLKNPYDGVLSSNGGKAKFGAHEYAEIFSGSSSIPVLDLSCLEERLGSGDCRSSKLDYSNIFGGLRDEEVGVPYEELFNGAAAKKTKTRISGKKNSSGDLSDESTDGIKKHLNMSFNKTSQRINDASNGTHIAKLHAVPGFTCFVDGTRHKTEVDRSVTSLKREVSRTWSFSAGVETQKDLEKSNVSDKSCNVNEVKKDNKDPRCSKLPSFGFTDFSGKIAEEDSPPSLDEEFDENSVAAVSAAALKKAIEHAQESIRIAKMIMERRKEGLQYSSKCKSQSRSKVKDKKEIRIDQKNSPSLCDEEIFINAGNVEVEMVRENNVEGGKEHGDTFADVDEEFAQSEIGYVAEKGDLVNVGQNIEAMVDFAGLVSNAEMKNEEENNDNLECSRNEFDGEMAEEDRSISERVREQEKSVDEALEQCRATVDPLREPENIAEVWERVQSCSWEKILHEEGVDSRINQEDEAVKETDDDVADDNGNCEEKFVNNLLEQEDMERKPKDDAHTHIESHDEEEIGEKEPDIFTLHETDMDDEKLNYVHVEDEQNLPGVVEKNENAAERHMDTSEYEDADTLRKSEVTQNAEETNYSSGENHRSEENQGEFDFQEAASEKYFDEVVDESSTVSCEAQAEEYEEAVKGNEENDSLPSETESSASGLEDKEAAELFDEIMPETDSLRRSASEENFIGSKLNDACEGASSDSNTENISSRDSDSEEKVPEDEEMSGTSNETHNGAEEDAAKINMQNLPEVYPSDNKAAELDQTSNDGFVSTSIHENTDEMSSLESQGCDETSNSNNEKVKNDLDASSNESENVEKSNCENQETGNAVEIEREVETNQNKNKEKQKDVKVSEQKYEAANERIEAIKRGREREKDRIAVERAIREARERAFAEARERAEREKAAAEARQRAKQSAEAKIKAERAAVERATTEARERALEKAMSHKTSAQAEREKSSSSRDNGLKHSYSSSDLEKFDGAGSESAQRRKARLERHQRIMERAAKALAEKNMRDILAQKEHAERNRLAESLDADIKRWATGKEGNLRALLSTLQYILGQESGWQPISLTEIITTAAVKKAYRKATLCVHPDKLQQRGASIQQKYICEKVFDLLKAAWNRFNSEER